MPAIRLKCQYCNLLFWASRKDSLYCTSRCRSKERVENAKFTPHYKSRVAGISWNRIISRWTAKVKIDGKWKYVGSFKDFRKAWSFQSEIYEHESKIGKISETHKTKTSGGMA